MTKESMEAVMREPLRKARYQPLYYGRTPRYKIEREILRATKQECRDRYLGKRIRFRERWDTLIGTVSDVRICGGAVTYIMVDVKKENGEKLPWKGRMLDTRPEQKVRRDDLETWEVLP